MEEWRDIEGYEGLYQVSDQGRVKSLNYHMTGEERILKQSRVCKKKYWRVQLYKNGRGKFYPVHRLVAQAFMPNPDNLPEINHKDENPSNNRVENLEWCDRKYNCNYGTRNQRVAEAKRGKYNTKVSKPVAQFTKSGNFIKEYPSTMEAYRQTGINFTNICYCCMGKNYRHTAGGYIWEYA